MRLLRLLAAALDSPVSALALLTLFVKLEKLPEVVRRSSGEDESLLRVVSAFGLEVMFGARNASFKS